MIGHIAFGVDGSNEVFAFDGKGHIYLLPMIGMSKNSAIKVCDSWNEYEKKLKKTGQASQSLNSDKLIRESQLYLIINETNHGHEANLGN